MIDVSHGNSQKVFKRQLENIGVVSKQISDGMNEIRGVMIESHLQEGNQKIGEDLQYGQSITDACIHFEDTKHCLSELYLLFKLEVKKLVKSDNLCFQKNVADTIGVEAAVILRFIEENKISASSIEDIVEIISEEFFYGRERNG